MRISRAIMALVGVMIAVPCAASGQESRSPRRIELIAMTPARVDATADPAAAAPTPPSSLPEAFRVHELSRRYVEYRMAQEFAAPAVAASSEQPTVGSSGPIATTSSIAVPGWMRGAYAVTPVVSYMPGCAPLGYRPAGFLGRDAEARRATYYGMMSAVACEYGIPTGLFDAMIIRESGYNPVAMSAKNAFGFAQLMPATAFGLGVDRYNPVQNMRGGARYLRQQLDRFGQVQLALAAYNAGPGRIHNGLVPAISETQAYVTNIIANWSRLSGVSAPYQQRGLPPRFGSRTAALSSF